MADPEPTKLTEDGCWSTEPGLPFVTLPDAYLSISPYTMPAALDPDVSRRA